MIAVNESATPDNRNSRADKIIAEACAKVGKARRSPVPFVNQFVMAKYWVDMMVEIACCYDESFDGSVLMELLDHKPKVLAYLFGHGVMAAIVQEIAPENNYGEFASNASSVALTYSIGQIYKQGWREGRDPSWSEIVDALKHTAPKP